ncbi:MAG: ComEC/Rec2 family competence protein, partial [Actinomycetota bacterium]|nr:ComEC/Rec2 family competence protein [Actinomycetota bacterium]
MPSVPALWCIAVAIATWLGVAAGLGSPFAAAISFGAAGVLFVRRYPVGVLAAFCVLGAASGLISSARSQAIVSTDLPSGTVEATLRIAEDPSSSTFGLAVGQITAIDGVKWDGPRVAIVSLPLSSAVGSLVTAKGTLSGGVRRVRDEVVAGTFKVRDILTSANSPNPIVTGGNAVRNAVGDRYDGTHDADGLLSGFLTGDTGAMSASDEEDLRRAGLAHFVAVSGSNVALFLGIWWVVTAPLSIHPRVRVVVGGVGLLLFAVITRWEPSVIRASVMASVLLAGGLFGIPVDPWMALGVAVTVLLLASGHLAMSVGFQLSVLATAGVLIGLAFAKGRDPKWLFVPLFSTVGAQAAVAPLLLVVFGTVPLLAPLTNLVVSPVIAITTVIGAIGVVLPPLAEVARVGASFVLRVA